LGVVDREGFATLTRAIREKDAGGTIVAVRSLLDHGHDVKLLVADLVEWARHLTMAKLGRDAMAVIDLPQDEVEELTATAALLELDELQRWFEIFSQAQEEIRFAFSPPFTLEMALVKATRVVALEPIEHLMTRVEALRTNPDSPGRDPGRRESSPAKPPGVRPPARPSSTAETPGMESLPGAGPRAGAESGPVLAPALAPEIEALWQRALQRAMDEKPHLGSYLGAGRVGGGGADEVVWEYEASQGVFGEMVAREENRTYLVRLLRELSNREIAFRVRPCEGLRRQDRSPVSGEVPNRGTHRTGGEPVAAPEKPSRRQLVSEVVAHPLVQEVLDVFGGEVMEVKDLKPGTP
jgi:hypothetical protein